MGGAGGTIGAQKVTNAAPDGYTLLVGANNEVAISRLVTASVKYEMKDFTPLGLIASQPMVLVASQKSGVKNVEQFISLVKANPGKFSYGSSGVGTALHLAGEMVKEQSGLFMTHIPYRGVAPLANDLLGNNIEFGVFVLSSGLPHIKSGKLVALGTTQAARSAVTPDITGWRTGTTGTPGVWQFDSGVPGRHVMIAALIHGNELCGAWALKGLLEAGAQPQAGKLTLAFCNLDAFDQFDPAHHDASRLVDEDLNRQWLVERMAAGNTLERRRAAALRPFVAQADWLLDLHSMHEPSAALMLTGMQPRNLALARQMRAPEHIVVDAGHKDGVRMRDFGRFGEADGSADNGTRSLLVECGFHGDPASRTVAQDQCVRFLQAAGALNAAAVAYLLPHWQQPDARQQWALKVTDLVVAKNCNFRFSEPYAGLEIIKVAGSVIGWNDGEPVTTPYDNCVLVMPSVRQAQAGVTVVRFARRSVL